MLKESDTLETLLGSLCEECDGVGWTVGYASGGKYEEPEQYPCTNELHTRLPEAKAKIQSMLKEAGIDELEKVIDSSLDGHMNGFHHGDWEESIKYRIKSLREELKS